MRKTSGARDIHRRARRWFVCAGAAARPPSLALLALLAPVLAPAAAAAEQKAIGRLKEVAGTATIISGEQERPARPGEPIYLLDVVETAGDGSLGIVFTRRIEAVDRARHPAHRRRVRLRPGPGRGLVRHPARPRYPALRLRPDRQGLSRLGAGGHSGGDPGHPRYPLPGQAGRRMRALAMLAGLSMPALLAAGCASEGFGRRPSWDPDAPVVPVREPAAAVARSRRPRRSPRPGKDRRRHRPAPLRRPPRRRRRQGRRPRRRHSAAATRRSPAPDRRWTSTIPPGPSS